MGFWLSFVRRLGRLLIFKMVLTKANFILFLFLTLVLIGSVWMKILFHFEYFKKANNLDLSFFEFYFHPFSYFIQKLAIYFPFILWKPITPVAPSLLKNWQYLMIFSWINLACIIVLSVLVLNSWWKFHSLHPNFKSNRIWMKALLFLFLIFSSFQVQAQKKKQPIITYQIDTLQQLNDSVFVHVKTFHDNRLQEDMTAFFVNDSVISHSYFRIPFTFRRIRKSFNKKTFYQIRVIRNGATTVFFEDGRKFV